MPFSFSRSPESITRSSTSACAENAWVCLSIASTMVVLPWSTCATIATLRKSGREAVFSDMRNFSRLNLGVRYCPPRRVSASPRMRDTGPLCGHGKRALVVGLPVQCTTCLTVQLAGNNNYCIIIMTNRTL